MQITPVILAGGGGARLWPLSRPERPKPLLKLFGARSLLQDTALRFSRDARFGPSILSVGEAFATDCLADMAAVAAAPALTVIEPEGRNTAAAIAAAALAAPADAMLLMAPADHAIADAAAFRDAVAQAATDAAADALVIFGVMPDRPETGYGYIAPAAAHAGGPLRPVARFQEKPAAAAAAALIGAGALWNAGLFLGRRSSFLAAFQTLAPDILSAVSDAMPAAAEDGAIALEASFAAAPAVAFDKAIMEKTGQARVAALNVGWSDVGDWNAVWAAGAKDDQGNVIVGDATVVDCHGCYVRGEGAAARAAGLRDMIVIATPEATLTLPRSAAQSVRRLADAP